MRDHFSCLAANFWTTMILGNLGEVALSAQGIAHGLNIISSEAVFGSSQSASYFVSEYYGARRLNLVKKVFSVTLPIAVALPAISLLLSLTIPKALSEIYLEDDDNDHNAILGTLKVLLPLTTGILTVDALKNLYYGCLSGASGVIGGQGLGVLANAAILGYRWHHYTRNEENIEKLEKQNNTDIWTQVKESGIWSFFHKKNQTALEANVLPTNLMQQSKKTWWSFFSNNNESITPLLSNSTNSIIKYER